MRVYPRLAEVLQVDPNDTQRVKEVAKKIGLNLHQLKYLLSGRAASILNDTLSKITAYVAKEKNIPPQEVFGLLFGIEPTHFWHLFTHRNQVIYVNGIRTNSFGELDVNFADYFLVATAQECVARALDPDEHPPLSSLRVCTAWNHRGDNHPEAREEANRKYRSYLLMDGDKGLFCAGSIKSNPIVERLFSQAFPGATAFRSEDDLSTAAERSCPFYLKYRNRDPRPSSCAAGTQLCVDSPGDAFGIYYESKYGDEWECVEWNETTDAALVFYCFYKSCEQLDMAICGYSGRATACVADLLRKREGHRFWPPVFSDENVLIGAYIVELTFGGTSEHLIDGIPYPAANRFNIIPLERDVIERRRKRRRSQPRTDSRKKSNRKTKAEDQRGGSGEINRG